MMSRICFCRECLIAPHSLYWLSFSSMNIAQNEFGCYLQLITYNLQLIHTQIPSRYGSVPQSHDCQCKQLIGSERLPPCPVLKSNRRGSDGMAQHPTRYPPSR